MTTRQDTTQEVTRPVSRLRDPSARRRRVLWAGAILGTALVITIYYYGARPRIPGMPALLGVAAGALVTWLACIGLAAWSAELLRRHHKAMAAAAWRHGKHAAVAGGRAGRRHGARAAAWAEHRWAGRQDARRSLAPAASHPDAGGGNGTAHPDARLTPAGIVHHDHSYVLPGECDECGGPGPGIPLVRGDRVYDLRADDGTLISPKGDVIRTDKHRALVRLPDGSLVRIPRIPATRPPGTQAMPAPPEAAPAAAATTQEGQHQMSTPGTRTRPSRQGLTPRDTPAAWKTLAADTADFEPEDDRELLGWMAAQTAGMLGYGEAIASLHEHCIRSVRADPAAMAALHDTADAVADAAEAMARAIEKFREVYEAPKGFVADGGVLPKDGDFLTGDDA